MKKSLFFALFACATLAFVGCEPKPEPDPQKDPVLITVTPDTLNLGVGDTEKLAAVVAPSGTQVQITWTSDNEEVVTVTPSGIVILVKLLQPEKALSPIEVTLLGITTEVKLLQSLNALSTIEVTLSEISTLVKLRHKANAPYPIDVTLYSILL